MNKHLESSELSRFTIIPHKCQIQCRSQNSNMLLKLGDTKASSFSLIAFLDNLLIPFFKYYFYFFFLYFSRSAHHYFPSAKFKLFCVSKVAGSC